jgi:integrase
MQSKFKFTKDSVRNAPPPGPDEHTSTGKLVKERIYWDESCTCLGLRVGRSGQRSFLVQKTVGGRSRKVRIGDASKWLVDEARARARQLIVQMDGGIDPNAVKRQQKAQGVTLNEAIEMHANAMRAKGCAPKSISSIREELERHLPDWLGRPLASITADECARRHERITPRAVAGPYSANRVMTSFRACYHTAARRFRGQLDPESPTVGVTFNKVRRKRSPIPWAELPTWFQRVQSIKNPVRRDLQLFILYTGLRSTDARTVRLEHIDFEAGTLHRPKPKGGEDRAFTVPISKTVLEILKRRRDENIDDGGWIFPSRDMNGRLTYVQQAKEQRYDELGRKVGFLPSPHRLRDTFATSAHEARVHPMDLSILMNHTLPAGTVTEEYIRPSVEHLMESAERIARYLTSKMVPKAEQEVA